MSCSQLELVLVLAVEVELEPERELDELLELLDDPLLTFFF